MDDSPAPPGQALLPLLRQVLDREGRLRWRLRGASMTPTLPPDCEIEIAPLSPHVRLGDILVFVSDDALIAHRLVRRRAGRWITQGDGRLAPDPPLHPTQALGRVTAAYAAGRRCWPAFPARPWALLWVARHYLLRPLLAGWRAARRLANQRRL